MDKPLDHLRRVRDELRAELEASEAFISWVAVSEAIANAEAKLAATEPSGKSHGRRKTADKAYEIIEERGRPIPTGELFNALTARGIAFTGNAPLKNLCTLLSKSERLESVQFGPSARDDRGWWFKDRPIPNKHEKGPAALTTGPSHSNGAAASST